MSNSIENTLVLCDLDNLLLNAEGNLPNSTGMCCNCLPAAAAS